MPWKKEDGDSLVTDENGNPIWIYDDGREEGWNTSGYLAKQRELVGLNKAIKKERDSLKEKSESFGDILNDKDRVELALKTLEEVEAGKLVADGKKDEAIQKALKEASSEFDAKTAAYNAQIEKLSDELRRKEEALHQRINKGIFEQSVFLDKKTKMPPDLAALKWGGQFKIEEVDGEVTPIPYINGEKMYSARPDAAGQIASPEEAIERFFNAYEHKDSFLKDLPGGPAATGGTGTPSKGEVSAEDFIRDVFKQ